MFECNFCGKEDCNCDEVIKYETCEKCGYEDYEGEFTEGLCDDCYEDFLEECLEDEEE